MGLFSRQAASLGQFSDAASNSEAAFAPELIRLGRTISSALHQELMLGRDAQAPEDTRAALAFGVLSIFESKLGSAAQATEFLDNAIKTCLDSKNPGEAFHKCAELHIALGDKVGAARYLEVALTKDLSSFDAAFIAGDLYRCGLVKEADKLLLKSIYSLEQQSLQEGFKLALAPYSEEAKIELINQFSELAKVAFKASSSQGQKVFIETMEELALYEQQPGLQNHRLRDVIQTQIDTGDKNGALGNLRQIYSNIEEFADSGKTAFWLQIAASVEASLSPSNSDKICTLLKYSLDIRREENPDPYVLAACLVHAAKIYQQIGAQDKSEQTIAQAQSLLGEIENSPRACALIQIELCDAYFKAQDPLRAQEHLDLAADFAKREGSYRERDDLVRAMCQLTLDGRASNLTDSQKMAIFERAAEVRATLPALIMECFIGKADQVNIMFRLAEEACQFGDSLGARELVNRAQDLDSGEVSVSDPVLYESALSAIAKTHPSVLTAFRNFTEALRCVAPEVLPQTIDETASTPDVAESQVQSDKLERLTKLLGDLLARFENFQSVST